MSIARLQHEEELRLAEEEREEAMRVAKCLQVEALLPELPPVPVRPVLRSLRPRRGT